jgi:very-short-patch-repair endonuclease
LRFWDNEIFENPNGVLEVIRAHCLKAHKHLEEVIPPPLAGGG